MLVVWISMMDSDICEAAGKAVSKFKDPRVTQFYDPQRTSGKAIAKSLGHAEEVAWDFYLFYPVGSAWGALPPVPEVYMHQLPNSWADRNRLFERKLLRAELTETIKSFFP
jgi:hypothetical protein